MLTNILSRSYRYRREALESFANYVFPWKYRRILIYTCFSAGIVGFLYLVFTPTPAILKSAGFTYMMLLLFCMILLLFILVLWVTFRNKATSSDEDGDPLLLQVLPNKRDLLTYRIQSALSWVLVFLFGVSLLYAISTTSMGHYLVNPLVLLTVLVVLGLVTGVLLYVVRRARNNYIATITCAILEREAV